jgi:serine/threonine-protein kinase
LKSARIPESNGGPADAGARTEERPENDLPMRDVEFLALLVHRGHVPRARAKSLMAALEAGAELDPLLTRELGWSAAQVEKLRRTRAGEIPEIPGYEILARAGTGGTADVFRARESASQRVLALKVLKPEAVRHEPTRKSFIAEARMLERLEHRGLVRCFGVARAGNLFFSRLEFIDGATVLERLDAQQRFAEDEALEIILATAEVLRYLGEQGVVHRDVKPGNIMLGKDRRVVLIDLGFAAEEATRCAADASVGTVAYLSPEQARGGAEADIRSDIYSLGISLFHILVGRLPFQGSDDRETLRKQVMESLSSPELKGRGISPHVHYFIEKMVAKDAAARYQSWAELIDDIRAQLAGRADLDFERDPRARRGRRP